ncbi:putative ABC transport system permease protein [Psychrobacillus insolitus]|uniref:Putative hemin transport system permease protein HrtB n=1 Tax=Psychrobacillus insolitus TaxID=1461 RepID=A0A2W7MCG8_9BACI|nr:ABC transporter permease [Psychrobacillus insolitus]PZX02942.1 putative ABC transport system permease protein [Psychrobacillus insolitus]
MFLALKELKHGKLRFTMIGLIIVLIAWLVFILSGLGNGLSTLSAATIKNWEAEHVVYENGAGATFSKSLLSQSLQSEIEAQPGVEEVAPFSQAVIAILPTAGVTEGEKKVDTALLGIEAGTFLHPEVVEGKALDPNIKNGVVGNIILKDQKGYAIGDVIAIDGSELEVEIIGFVENETFNHLPSLFANMDFVRDYKYAAPGSNNGVEDAINAFAVLGKDVDAEQMIKAVDGVEVVTKSAAINGMPGYTAENGTIMMMLVFLIVISAFVIAVFFYVLTIQKTQQFGVMKAIGASNGFIARAIVSQVFVLSFFSILVGIGLTYLTAMVFPEEMPFNLDPALVITYGIVLLAISVGSSLFSVRRISKIDPLTALGRVE